MFIRFDNSQDIGSLGAKLDAVGAKGEAAGKRIATSLALTPAEKALIRFAFRPFNEECFN